MALKSFKQMLDEGGRPDHVTFLGVLSACRHAGLIEEGKHYFKSLIHVYGISPTIEHYAYMISILGRAGAFNELMGFIDDMEITPDPSIWQIVLGACTIHKNVEIGKRAAEKLFKLVPQMDSGYVLLSKIYAQLKMWTDVAMVRGTMTSRRVKKEPGCSWIHVNGYEIFERMAYNGISDNLVLYLTNKLHESTVTSSNNVSNWAGTVWLTPLLGAYIADAYLGRWLTFIIAASIYLLGMFLLTLTVSLPSLRPPPCNSSSSIGICDSSATPFQVGIFYFSLYIIALGAGGTKPNISTMGADQFDDFEPKERAQKLSFFNWWMFSIFFGGLISHTVIIYIQDNVSWSIGYGIPTAGLALAILFFLAGTKFYRHRVPSGSPLTKLSGVLKAAIFKWRVPLPEDPKELYELDSEHYTKEGKYRIRHSTILRFLDKAAVKNGSRRLLCPVTQVEETKQMVKMLPVLFVTFIPTIVNAQSHTLFIKQAVTLDRSIGPQFKVPPASLSAFMTISMLVGIIVYDGLFVPMMRKHTKNPRGITLLQRLGIGLALHLVILITASLIETRRLSVVRDHGMAHQNTVVPLSFAVLLPQYVLLGIADVFTEVGKIEFFYDQAPEGMKSLGTSFYTTGTGVGKFLNSFILSTISDVSKRGGGEGWIQNNLNSSHLDYYYGSLTVIVALNFVLYLVVSKLYVYNSEPAEGEQIDQLRLD